MGFFKNIHYVYIIFAIMFIYDGIERLQKNESHPWLSFIIAAVAVFMFFFRRKFSKKFEDRYKK
jgi:hypothetical protein